MQTVFINNNQGAQAQNVMISGLVQYATNDYGASWATSATIAADLLALYPVPQNGDIAILRNTNGTDESRVYFYAASAWEAIATATIANGSVTAAKCAAGMLSADATGRAIVADDFFNNATCDAKFDAAAFAADADSLAIFADGIWNLAKLAQEAKTHIMPVYVPALAAGADLTMTFAVVPTGFVLNVLSASITPAGTSAGIDDSNTSVWAVTDGTNTLVTKTFDADPAFPASGTNTDLGAISASYDNVPAGAPLKLVITNGTTAATPQGYLHVLYYLTAA